VIVTDQQYQTERLTLRPWQDQDKPAFAAMNADPRVMEFFPALRTREQSDAMVDECNRRLAWDGFTFWAVECRDTGEFIGFVGLNTFDLDLPFCPCVEIGWRLAFAHWGNGYATEAATACLSLAFKEFALTEVLSFTTLSNVRSRHVMEKIGMVNTNDNFLHPLVDASSGMQEHCLYRITRSGWTSVTTKAGGT
jgi:RimJ/RimL family protein N-acetyltransferase